VPYVSPYKNAPLPSPPELDADAAEAWELFSACSSQLILGGLGGVCGVKHDTLYQKMAIRGIPRERWFSVEQLFIYLERHYTKFLNNQISSGSDKNDVG
jgi:hypothetical protein